MRLIWAWGVASVGTYESEHSAKVIMKLRISPSSGWARRHLQFSLNSIPRSGLFISSCRKRYGQKELRFDLRGGPGDATTAATPLALTFNRCLFHSASMAGAPSRPLGTRSERSRMPSGISESFLLTTPTTRSAKRRVVLRGVLSNPSEGLRRLIDSG